MRRTIWTFLSTGRDGAPALIRRCLSGWRERNPTWELRCLTPDTISRYIDIEACFATGPPLFSELALREFLSLALLHEFGGIWVEPATLCNLPLDEWLPSAADTGFFAFAEPAGGCALATWLLASAPGNRLLSQWFARAILHCAGRQSSPDPFWLERVCLTPCASAIGMRFRPGKRYPD